MSFWTIFWALIENKCFDGNFKQSMKENGRIFLFLGVFAYVGFCIGSVFILILMTCGREVTEVGIWMCSGVGMGLFIAVVMIIGFCIILKELPFHTRNAWGEAKRKVERRTGIGRDTLQAIIIQDIIRQRRERKVEDESK